MAVMPRPRAALDQLLAASSGFTVAELIASRRLSWSSIAAIRRRRRCDRHSTAASARRPAPDRAAGPRPVGETEQLGQMQRVERVLSWPPIMVKWFWRPLR